MALFPSFDPSGLAFLLHEPEAGVLRAQRAVQALARQAGGPRSDDRARPRDAGRRPGRPRRRPDAGGRRRRLGVRRLAGRAVRPRRRDPLHPAGAVLLRRRPGVARARCPRVRRLRPGDLRHPRPRRPRRQGRAGLRRAAARPRRRAPALHAGERGDRPRVPRRALPGARRRAARRLQELPLRAHPRRPLRRRAAARAPVRLVARRRLRPRLQARPRGRRARRRRAGRRGRPARPFRAARPRAGRHVPHCWRHDPRRRRVGPMHDYLIVGAGSAGCALAARLTEDPDVSVILLEAGPPDSEEALHIPVAFSQLYRTPFDWDYLSGPEPGLGGRELYVPRGRVLGGSSSLNAMIYIRGNQLDYAAWGPGWGWDDVLPYFIRAEDNERGASPLHGAGGPLSVSDGRSQHPLATRMARGRRGRRAGAERRLQRPAPGRRRPLPADPARRHALLRRGRLPPPRAQPPEPHAHPRRAGHAAAVRRHPRGRRRGADRGRRAGDPRRARGRGVRRRLQLAAAADAVRDRPRRASASAMGSTSGSTCRRWARTCPTTSTPG